MHIVIPDNLDQAGLDILDAVEGISYLAPAKMTREELLNAADSADGLIIRSASTIDAEALAAFSKLKAIARAGVGVDNVDLDVATERGVVVMNAPDGNTIATTEHTFAMMLALSRYIPQAYNSMRDGKWDKKSFMGVELRGKTLGIIGFGRIGRALAKRAQAFEMNVIAYDPYIPAEAAQQTGVALLDLDELYTRADYISLHSLVTDETRGMINAQSIGKMKDGVRIINVARGAFINDADLAAAIQSGKVAGAAVDVFVKEPPPQDHPLLGLNGVLHTPHLGASTVEAQNEVAVQAAQNLLKALLKGEYNNVVNPAVLAKL